MKSDKRNRNLEKAKRLMVILALALVVAGTAWAQSMGGVCHYNPRNAAEAYCSAHGGCPSSGNCYFPDGSVCGLWSFYNGTCPGREYLEQAMWNAEIYSFLYSDDCYDCSGRNAGYIAPASYIAPAGYIAPAYSAAYWKSEADKYYIAGSYAKAADMYAKAVQTDPSLAPAWLNMGNCLYFLGRYQESLAAYEAAIRIDPGNAGAWRGKGQTLLALNRVGEANDALGKAQALMSR